MVRHLEYMKKKFKELEDKSKEQQVKYLSGTKKEEQSTDMVNSPIHYNKAGIETIDALQAMLVDGFDYYLQGNIVKYLWRFRYKNGLEDLKKAQWYLNKLIETYEEK